ncbi:trans-Golgi network-localized SYP41-interacting protein 1-like [Rhododendron vialii]|uniref:trans-Golgi network-localized SYP41-interacting protein 1-like n=1 Tax=Rhododendron vialii TaxID=182163 RepID=UPI00265F098F|nr:trans-Golgi network-localized SYP41-interacting protein 1-like [Rhododendron vialii]XP_058195146.1 trans-Golgi network-localized SYP41-interacting protein 1-like [Rhododendron vialii]
MNDKEAEILSLRNALSTKEKEAEEAFMSASQVKSLYDKVNDLEVPFAEFKVGDTDFHNSDHAKKLFYIIDVVTPMMHHMNSLSHEKEELQATLVKQVQEIEHLKEKVEQQNLDKQDYENMKNELFELEFTLESIIQKLGGNDLVEDPKTIGVKEFIPVLEKLVMAVILESENSKSKAQELSAKLLGSQKVVDELSNKVKFLEDSKQGRSVSPEVARETGIFEASSLPTRSEITEIEDAGPIAKKAVAPAAFAAHARTLREGSNDNLAIDIDSESDRLIKNEETD